MCFWFLCKIYRIVFEFLNLILVFHFSRNRFSSLFHSTQQQISPDQTASSKRQTFRSQSRGEQTSARENENDVTDYKKKTSQGVDGKSKVSDPHVFFSCRRSFTRWLLVFSIDPNSNWQINLFFGCRILRM